MADYNISGLVPAMTGGSWDGGSSWFLLDQSGTFSIDKDLTCTIYLVGGGCKGNGSGNKSAYQGGYGGAGGYVRIVRGIKIPKNTECNVVIADTNNRTGTSLNISDTLLNCNDDGSTTTTGGRGGYVYWMNSSVGFVQAYGSSSGVSGVATPYGIVGSSGGGGGADCGSSRSNAYGSVGGTGAGYGAYRKGYGYNGGNAITYGSGGGGSYAYKSSTYGITSAGAGKGKGGCVIICVTEGYYPLPYLEKTEFGYNGKEHHADGANLKNFDSTVMEVSGTVSGTYVSTNEDGGTYKIRVSFKPGNNFKWVDDSGNVYTPTDKDGNAVDYIELEWKINPIEVSVPTLSFTSVPYEGWNCNKTVDISGFNSDLMTKTGVEFANKAGKYPIVFSLKDTDSSVWVKEDNTKTTDDVVVTWEITPIKVDRPSIIQSEFTYSGNSYYPFDNAYNPENNLNNYNPKVMYAESNGCVYSAYLANADGGYYTAKYTIYDHESCAWSDSAVTLDEETGTWVDNTDLTETITWRINKRIDKIPMPYLTPTGTDADGNNVTEFTYTGRLLSPMINNKNTTYATYGGDFSAVKVGDWKITATLKTNANIIWRWDDGTKEGSDKNIELKWKINKIALDLPTVTPQRQNYDGTVKTVNAASYDFNLVTRTGSVSGTSAKEYTLIYVIKDKECAEWATTEEDKTKDQVISWWIDPIKIKPPTADKKKYIVSPTGTDYNSGVERQYLEYTNNDANVVLTNVADISGHYGDYPGIYTAIFTLKDPTSASWDNGTADGTDEAQTIEWEIIKKEYLVTKPSIKETPLTYTGISQTVQFNGRNDGQMIIGGETSGTAARAYKATAALRESRVYDYKWADNSTTDIELGWDIERAAFEKPTLTERSFGYDGLTHSVTVNGFNSNVMEYEDGAVFSGKAARNYPIIVRLKDKSSAYWEDGGTDNVDLTWVIDHARFDIPVVTDTVKTYNGSTQRPTITGYNSNVMYLKQTASAANAGTYEFCFELIDPYSSSWTDGTTEIKRFRWTINKAVMTLSKPYLTASKFTYNGYTYVYQVTNSSHTPPRGYVYLYVRDVNNTYMSVSGTLRAVSANDYKIIITLKDTQNYIAKWNDGTDTPIELGWKIKKAVFEIPTLSSYHFNYGGRWESPKDSGNYKYSYKYASVSGFNAWVMNTNCVTGYRSSDNTWISTRGTYYENSAFYTPSQWRIGKYYARFYLKDPASATWSNGTNGEITLEWSISKEIVLLKRPYLEENSFEYDGTVKRPVITNETAGIVFTGTRNATEVGNYDITAQLYREFKDDDIYDYRWDDNTVEDVIVMPWKIWSDEKIAVPNIAPKSFVYNGNPHSPEIHGFNSDIMLKSGTFSATKKGVYEITFSLKHPDSIAWSNGTTDPVVLSWEIAKGTAQKPYLAPDNLMYDAYRHTVEFVEDDTGNSYVAYNFDPDTMNYGGDKGAIQVGEYSFEVSLIDPESCTWDDGTTDTVPLPFYISKKTVLLDIPYLKENSFVFDGLAHTPKIELWETPGMEKSGDLTKTAAGNYKITLSLIEDRNITYLWSDHSDAPIELSWGITGRTAANGNGIEKPVVTDTEFVYDGTKHAPVVSPFDTNLITQQGTAKATNATTYEITFILKDKASSTWADGTTDDYVVSWKIKKAEIEKPTVVQTSFLYNGVAQDPIYDGLDKSTVVFGGDVDKISAGNYTQTVTPDSNHIWADGTMNAIFVDWEITRTRFKKPTLKNGVFDFNGALQTPEFDGFDGNVMKMTGKYSMKPAGSYSMEIALKDTNSCEWDDGTTDSLPFSWVINKAYFDVPVMTKGAFDFNGVLQTPEFDILNDDFLVKKGDYEEIAAGDYKMQIALADPVSSAWRTADGSVDVSDKEYSWKINPITINIPTVEDLIYNYDGNPHKPTVTGLNTDLMDIEGASEQTNAGDYTVTISLKYPDSCKWSDGTADPKTTDWVINKIEHEKPRLEFNEFNYNGGDHIPRLIDIDYDIMTKSGDTQETDAGIYNLIVSFKDSANHKWVGGDSDPLPLEWIIHGRPVDKPTLEKDNFAYDGKSKTPVILGFKSSAMLKGGDLKRTNVGNHKIIITLRPNYEWTGGGFEPLELPWEITKNRVKKPEVIKTEFTYDKFSHAPEITGFNPDTMLESGTFSAVNAGDYEIRYTLIDKDHIEWDDGSGSEDYVIPWYIGKKAIKKPKPITTNFEYNGGLHKPVIENFEHYAYYNSDGELIKSSDDVIIVTGTYNGATDAGNYNITCSILDKDNYIWEDGTSGNVTIGWYIAQKPIPKPHLIPEYHEYDGTVKSVTVSGFVSDAMCYPSENGYDPYPNDPIFSAAELGEYPVTIGLWAYRRSKNGVTYRVYNYCWDDGDTSYVLPLKWYIVAGEIEYPTLTDYEYTFTGNQITPSKKGYNSELMNIVGNASAVNAGDYSIGFTLKDPVHFKWKNGTVDGTLIPWKINRAKLSKVKLPYLDKNLIYNAREQTPPWRDYDIRKLSIEGVNHATNVGTYTATFTPTANYIWDDGTLDPMPVSWEIEKLGIITPKQNNTLYYNGKTQAPNWTTSYNLKNVTYTGQTSGVDVNEYVVSCKCDSNCYFLDTGTDACTATWKIRKRRLQAPYPEKRYPYTANEITPVFLRYEPDIMQKSGVTKATDTGKYTAYFKLTETDNYMWAVGVYLTTDELVPVDWYIVESSADVPPTRVPVPYQNNYLVYNKEPQSPAFANYNGDITTLLGGIPSRTDAGTYYVTFRLKSGYVWSDNTTEDKKVEWIIEPQKVPFPYILTAETDGGGMYYYELEGKKYPVWVNYNSELMRMSGDTYDVDFSWHTTEFELKDKRNYIWIRNNDAYEKYPVSWKLSQAYTKTPSTGRNKVHIPRQANRPIEDGTTKYPEWDRYDNIAIINRGGEWEGVTAGERYVILELYDGYIWEDDTNEIKAVPWKIYEVGTSDMDIEPIPIRIPEQINPPYYDGHVKEPEWDSWDDYGFDIIEGVLMEVPAGEYRIKLRLKTGYIWEDGTTEDKVITWVINPRAEIPDADIPRDPAPEREGDGNGDGNGNNGTGCGYGCCCCDMGLYDILKKSCPEDDEHYDCT